MNWDKWSLMVRLLIRSFWQEMVGWVLLVLLFSIAQYFLCIQTNTAILSVDLQISKPAVFKVYWATSLNGYREKQSRSIPLEPGQRHYDIPIPSLASISSLRIDPIDGPGMLTIHKMSLRQSLYVPITLDFQAYLQQHPVTQGLSNLQYTHGSGFSLHSIDNDPWFVVVPDNRIDLEILLYWILGAVIVGLVLFALTNSNLLKGSKERGIIQVEVDDTTGPTDPCWLETLEKLLPDIRLCRAIDHKGRRSYLFVFAKQREDKLVFGLDRLHQDHPYLRLHLQWNRSGEV